MTRGAGGLSSRARKRLGPPEGEPWVWFTRKMLESPAMRGLGVNARRVLDFVCIEHMSHAGTMNGQLLAPYHQLVKFGVARSEISGAIRQLEAFGLIKVSRRGRLDGKDSASHYTLTWLPVDGEARTDDWRRVTNQDVADFARQRRVENAQRKSHRRARARSSSTIPEVGAAPR